MAYAITVSTDLGDTLRFARMTATEELGRLFSFRIELLSQDGKVDLLKLLGTPMTVKLDADGFERHFNGIVSEAGQTGFTVIKDVQYAVYAVTVVPKPWLLTQRADCRIYTGQSVPDIVKAVLAEIGYTDVKLSLRGTYAAREYCVQYRETYFNFISRLLEQEGIYYYFTHAANAHTMVLADDVGAHSAVRGFETIPFLPPTQHGTQQTASIFDWRSARSARTVKYELTDYDPMNPRTSLAAKESLAGSDYPTTSGLEGFDYPGNHVAVAAGQHYARVHLEAANVEHLKHSGATGAWGMAAGALFKLTGFPLAAQNKEYLVVGTRIRLEGPGYVSGSGGDEQPFECSFEAIDSKQPFRSLPTAVKPVIAGLQTAIVAGSKTAEDISVDKYGRITVTFHWNKPDRKNAHDSCPVRVASSWAGKAWGAVSIPRVGQEVVVSFLEGDPDRPLVIGSVYNADNMPPYTLPDNKTQSGVKSRSHQGGGTADFNEIRFEDKKGSEELFLHAQKDMREEVENDHFVDIDHDETINVKNDQTLTVTNDQTEEVKHDRKHTVGNDDTLDVKNNGTTTIGQKFKLDAGSEITLVTGSASITMKSSGEIEIKGTKITIKGSQSVDMQGTTQVGIKGAKVDIGGDASMNVHTSGKLDVAGGMSTVKGNMLTLTGTGMAKLGGGIVMIG